MFVSHIAAQVNTRLFSFRKIYNGPHHCNTINRTLFSLFFTITIRCRNNRISFALLFGNRSKIARLSVRQMQFIIKRQQSVNTRIRDSVESLPHVFQFGYCPVARYIIVKCTRIASNERYTCSARNRVSRIRAAYDYSRHVSRVKRQ
jgi:hypothetical protein